ncbi:Salt tolerance receptor-like cytoplasmic kinase [Sesamum angolense]|uniref:Salt tolerance receptor-like cytoplasmic kinase n=1 Tax=Sesamum angolense TaxID=2727404 RepID=A0AAE1WVK6_9LAMI|nr:Salt tolerance receptor-like cytoplasmic kinase [Sesamum angolense]
MGRLPEFLRFKLRRQRAATDRVAAVDLEEEEEEETSACICKHSGNMRLCWDEIRRVTMEFSVVVGHGGFSTVYLAEFPDSSRAAVKMQCGGQRLSRRAYRQELEILRRLRHHTIVKLLGYCDDREEGILLLEYVPNGNLQEKLQGSNTFLPWKTRMAVAFQLAQAIAYLHRNCIVHGDIKASNILLDDDLNCKLCDFGSAKMGLSSTVAALQDSNSRMMVARGEERRWATWAGPMLRDVEKVGEMVDRRICGEIDLEEARAMAALSATCVSDSPSIRPSAADILTTMRSKIPSLSLLFEEKVA